MAPINLILWVSALLVLVQLGGAALLYWQVTRPLRNKRMDTKEEKPPVRVIACETIGVSGTTDVYVKRRVDGLFEARVGIALMGETNLPADVLLKANPFNHDFRDNFAWGQGQTEEAAIERMKIHMQQLADSLWAEWD